MFFELSRNFNTLSFPDNVYILPHPQFDYFLVDFLVESFSDWFDFNNLSSGVVFLDFLINLDPFQYYSNTDFNFSFFCVLLADVDFDKLLRQRYEIFSKCVIDDHYLTGFIADDVNAIFLLNIEFSDPNFIHYYDLIDFSSGDSFYFKDYNAEYNPSLSYPRIRGAGFTPRKPQQDSDYYRNPRRYSFRARDTVYFSKHRNIPKPR